MADAVIRVGKLSSIDYEKGKARVVYEDRDNSVTVAIPVMCSEDIGLLHVQDSVLVAHLSNGTANGIVIGRFFTNNVCPVDGKKDKYYKSFTHDAASKEAYMQYEKKEMIIKAPKFYIETEQGKEEVIPKIQNHEERIQDLEIRADDFEKRITELERIAKDHEQRIVNLGG